MSDVTLTVTQRPDHVVEVGQTVIYEGTPYIVKAVKPQREKGVFLDWSQKVESNEVIVTVERFDGHPA